MRLWIAAAVAGLGLAGPPTPQVPITFVPDFTFQVRISGLDPPPSNAANVKTVMEWGWGERAGETQGFLWSAPQNFTRNATGARWANTYPNTYGLRPQYFTGFRGDDEILVTHLYFCHIGAEPSQNASVRPQNQTTRVELNVTLDGAVETLSAALLWGGLEGSCDDLGLVVGRHKSTNAHFVETFRAYNARRYWSVFNTLAPLPTPPTKFPVMDGFTTSDGDLDAIRDALRASKQLGLHGLEFSGPAWLQRDELGYALTSAHGEVALLAYAQDAPNVAPRNPAGNLSTWASGVAAGVAVRGFEPSEVKVSPIHDEPGMLIPRDLPPVHGPNASQSDLPQRWVGYLQRQGLTPGELGFASWADVAPSTAGGRPGAPIESRRLYYHSLRFVSWDSGQYLANATRALEARLQPGAPIYSNWNNMGAHWYYPGKLNTSASEPSGTGQLNHDWFEFARERGGTMLWTEDWFGDGLSWQWSYYAALLSSACRLAEPFGGAAGFGGYVVPRSSEGAVNNALLRRVVSLIGGGAKALAYFDFGPEYIFPGNCYSESPRLASVLTEQRQAHALIGAVEDVLWPARRVANHVAILAHRSSNAWDPAGTAKWENQTEQTMGYQADQYGLYLSLAVHGGVPCDFLDEDAALRPEVLAEYQALFVTQPNVPRKVLTQVSEWVAAGGVLVLSAGAATADEYNDTDTTLEALTESRLSPLNRRVLPQEPEVAGPSPLPIAGNGTVLLNGEAQPFNALGDVNRFLAVGPTARKLGSFWEEGSVSGVETKVGRGRIVQLAWQPGMSYLPNATQEYAIPDPKLNFPSVVRDFLKSTIGDGVHRTAARIEGPGGEVVIGVEAILLAGPDGAVVTVVNWGGAATGDRLCLCLNRTAAGLGQRSVDRVVDAWTGESLNVSASSTAPVLNISFLMRDANFIAVYPKALLSE